MANITRALAQANAAMMKSSSSSLSFLTPLPLPTSNSHRVKSHLFLICARATSTATPASPSTLVVVESPAKAATIQKFLPDPRYRVRSCVGHVRELPGSAKRIPAKYKAEPWARLGVDVENDFRPLYVLISGKQSIITQLKTELRQAEELILATDEDREGEAISWHLVEVLKPTVKVKRAVFHEITPEAIEHAFENCRDIDLNLVQAQETRRVLDRLAGYTMSPLLWKKVAKGLSAGRVQSVAMAAIVRRELKRLRFVRAQYCGCSVQFCNGDKTFVASLSTVDGVRMVKGADFEDETGKLTESAREKEVKVYDRKAMTKLCNSLDLDDAVVTSADKRRTSRNPPAPFITSTLQQECGNKLGFGAGKTMLIAQKLYENGHITYMRTDNPGLSDQAIRACRTAIEENYGTDYLSDGNSPASRAKPKGAQAAHEAIRPAGSTFSKLCDLHGLEEDEKAVYNLIYRRTLASQMNSAKLDQTTVKVEAPLKSGSENQVAEFKATGSVIVHPGFLKAYEDEDATKSTSSFLPPLQVDDKLTCTNFTILDHETKPPPRYNDASLVKELEEAGIGRPSTYSSIIEKIITRGYVFRGRMLPEGKGVPARALVPSLTAFAVENLLSKHFPSFVDAEFTARMEEALDEIAAGTGNRVHYLKEYYCGDEGLAALVERTEKEIEGGMFRQILLPNMPKEMLSNASSTGKGSSSIRSKKSKNEKASKRPKAKANASKDDSSTAKDSSTTDWSNTRVLVSSYGPYVEKDGTVVASLPKSTLADDLSPERLDGVLQIAQDPEIGVDPESGMKLLLKTSRYGPYVQLGREEDYPEGVKPKRCGLFPGMDVGTLTVELAAKLISLPRLLGHHPVTGKEIRAALGPYGPYIVHENSYVSLKKENQYQVLEIEFEEALELLLAAERRKQVRREKQALKKSEEQMKVSGEQSSRKTKAVKVKNERRREPAMVEHGG